MWMENENSAFFLLLFFMYEKKQLKRFSLKMLFLFVFICRFCHMMNPYIIKKQPLPHLVQRPLFPLPNTLCNTGKIARLLERFCFRI